jgi:hypothetical protein
VRGRGERSTPPQLPRASARTEHSGQPTPTQATQAALWEILHGPACDDPDDGDEPIDPHEGWEPVPPTLDQLVGWLRSIDNRYESVPWSSRRWWIVGWLQEINQNYGPFRCLDDLSSALFSVDDKDGPTGHPLLQPECLPGRPKLRGSKLRARCLTALAIDALKMAGLSIKDSASEVADWLSKDGFRVSTRRYSVSMTVAPWETVKQWREEIVRIANGKGQYHSVIREIARDYLRQRARLRAAVTAGGIDPRELAVLFLSQRAVPLTDRRLTRLRKT